MISDQDAHVKRNISIDTRHTIIGSHTKIRTTGLPIRAELDEKTYATGIKITKQDIEN